MNTRNILMFAGGAIAGYLIYDKFIKKNGGNSDFSGAKIKYKCCCSDGSTHTIRGNMSCPCGVSGNNATEVQCRKYTIGASF